MQLSSINNLQRLAVFLVWLAYGPALLAQIPDHPVITEIYTDPAGLNDGPVGRDIANAHQEYIEIYLPTCANLAAGLNCDAVNLTFYEVEGDSSSSGVELMNYRFDLPTFDLDLTTAPVGGAIPRPPSGVVVLGWVDYLPDPLSGLLGTPGTRTAMINGGIMTTGGDFIFIAINGNQFDGTTNFDPVLAENLIDLPNEASSGVIQNGSGVYLLVNRDAAGFVSLCDDKHATDCNAAGICRGSLLPCSVALDNCADGTACLPAGAAPILPSDLAGLKTTALFDGFAANDDGRFRADRQPPSSCGSPPDQCDDLQTVLVDGGAFSLLIPQFPEKDKTRFTPTIGNGYSRKFVDVAKTTEDPFVIDDPNVDTANAYQLIRNAGPFFPTPGVAVMTSSPPELSVALASEQLFDVLTQTTGHPGLFSANTGGVAGIDISASGGTSSDANVATFASGFTDTNVTGQTFGYPSIAVTLGPGAIDQATASASVMVSALPTGGGAPLAAQAVTVTARIIDPTTGLDSAGLPFQATVFLAIQPVADNVAIANEFLLTDVGAFLAARTDGVLLGTVGNASLLLDPAVDLSNQFLWNGRVAELPSEFEGCTNWINPLGPAGKLDFLQTIATSAEVLSGATSYVGTIAQDTTVVGIHCSDGSGASCASPLGIGDKCNGGSGICTICGPGAQTKVKAKSFNHPDTLTSGGSFSPSEIVSFADGAGIVGNPRSGLTNATTTRTFELLIVDTNLNTSTGSIETGLTDDFGLIIEVLETEAGSTVETGEFVFLSFTGGLQGADIDPIIGEGGTALLQLIYLDLDTLMTELKILSIERTYIVDASGSSEIDVLEVFSLNPVTSAVTSLVSSSPDNGRSLWRTSNNVMRLTFSQDITLPASGDILIQELLPSNGFGVDLSSGFSFVVENDMSSNPRILRIEDIGASDMVHRGWYGVRNLGSWIGVSNFEIQYVIQVGDSDADGLVSNSDASLVNAAIPNFAAADDDRRDIDGNGSIVSADVGFANTNIPSFVVPKPSGH